MLSWFRRRAQDRRTAIDLYGAIVTRARAPAFFACHGVRDTPEGRAATLILLMFPVIERLQAGGPKARRVARLLTETFVTDMDDCLREMGVGDLAVPRKVKRAAQALGERCSAYARAAAAPLAQAALAAELASTVPGLDINPQGADALAGLVLAFRAELMAAPPERLLAGPAALPEVGSLATAAPPPG